MMKKTPSKPKKEDISHKVHTSAEPARKVPLWQAILLPIAAVLLFFFLLEGALALFGVKPALKTEDPFVGFSSSAPLFVPAGVHGGQEQLTTAANKSGYFNAQSFSREKAPGTYRIFTLGGSTTYGRPYNDVTSFSGWLREFLPAADKSRNWEVINAGGVSYASYRVAHLMEELVNYQPDLFIIYTGHNEFLEERTYAQIRDMSPVLRTTVSVLAQTRTWSALDNALQKMGVNPEAPAPKRDKLAREVNAILDKTAGLERYNRDDTLKQKVLEHYKISLERMVALARSVDAQVLFVTPASSLNDCTPFKSENSPGLDAAAKERSEKLLDQAKNAMNNENWRQALDLLDMGVSLDPRHAEMHYRRGQTLMALSRYEEAKTAFILARDEDVCPLRALTETNNIVFEVAEEQDVDIVDYVTLLDRHMQQTHGHGIPGEELFLDHVHPTIEGHKLLALSLVDALEDRGLVQPGEDWTPSAVAAVETRIESKIDREAHGQALANLARVLSWAGKREDAARLARQAQETAGDYRQIAVDSASILATVYLSQGQPELATQLLYSTLEKAPGAIELRMKLGENLLDKPFERYEEGAANILLVCQQMPNLDHAQALFGHAMAKRGRLGLAYAHLMEALRINPKNTFAQSTLMMIQPLLGDNKPNPEPPRIMLQLYPSRAPKKLIQVRQDANGRPVYDGVEVEFHENGRVKRFVDIMQGVPNGLELTWSPDGKLLSRVVYRQGTPISDEMTL